MRLHRERGAVRVAQPTQSATGSLVTDPGYVLRYAERLGLRDSPPYSDPWRKRSFEAGYEAAVRDLVAGKVVGYGVVVTWR